MTWSANMTRRISAWYGRSIIIRGATRNVPTVNCHYHRWIKSN